MAMTQEEKQILLQGLCGRLPHGIICNVAKIDNPWIGNVTLDTKWLGRVTSCFYEIKPYLRPLSSMTKEEMRSIPKPFKVQPNGHISSFDIDFALETDIRDIIEITDWLNEHHFDYRGLINKKYKEYTYRGNKIVEYADGKCTAFFSKYDVDDEQPNIEDKDFDNLLDAQTWIDSMSCR